VAFFVLGDEDSARAPAPAERRAPHSPMRGAARPAAPAGKATGTHGNFRPYEAAR
jgi:hypothetical protein